MGSSGALAEHHRNTCSNTGKSTFITTSYVPLQVNERSRLADLLKSGFRGAFGCAVSRCSVELFRSLTWKDSVILLWRQHRSWGMVIWEEYELHMY